MGMNRSNLDDKSIILKLVPRIRMKFEIGRTKNVVGGSRSWLIAARGGATGMPQTSYRAKGGNLIERLSRF
jgi:hypothetical protein